MTYSLTTIYKEALERVLTVNRLDVAKEIAADALDVDINDYIDEDDIEAGSAYDFEDSDEAHDPNDVLAMFE